MPKKKLDEENINKEIEKEQLEIPIETVSEKEPEKPVSEKTRYIVFRNEGHELVLEDARGNGVRISTPEEFKNVKKGDIVYL